MNSGFRLTVVVLCESYEDAVKAFRDWLEYLQLEESGSLQNFNEANLSIELDGILRYIFCDYRLEETFAPIADSFIDINEFLSFEANRITC